MEMSEAAEDPCRPARSTSQALNFNPSGPLQSESHGFCKCPDLKDKIHCVTYVLDGNMISIMSTKSSGIPQLVLLTKVDEACPLVKEDIRNVYKNIYIKDLMQEAASRVGVAVCCAVPVENHFEELDLDMNTDILLLSAVVQMLRFVDNYIDEINSPKSRDAVMD